MTAELFESNNGAEFSECGKYRYALWRIWDENKPLIMFIGINPSTANATSDDPTIRRVKRFANDWGYGGVYMLNLFAYITPYPSELDTSGENLIINDQWLREIYYKVDKIICAWGSFKNIGERAQNVKNMFPIKKHALKVNQDGSPRHPLYVPAKTIPVIYD